MRLHRPLVERRTVEYLCSVRENMNRKSNGENMVRVVLIAVVMFVLLKLSTGSHDLKRSNSNTSKPSDLDKAKWFRINDCVSESTNWSDRAILGGHTGRSPIQVCTIVDFLRIEMFSSNGSFGTIGGALPDNTIASESWSMRQTSGL